MPLPNKNAVECPACKGRLLRVTNSRATQWEGVTAVRRHRTCDGCGLNHTTLEVAETTLKDYRKKIGKEIVKKLINGDF